MITQLSEELGLTPRAIRYYEEVGLIVLSRDRCNVRRFDRRARERLWMISELRRCGISLADIRRIFRTEDDGPDALRKCVLARLQRRLLELDMAKKTVCSAVERFRANPLLRPGADAERPVAR